MGVSNCYARNTKRNSSEHVESSESFQSNSKDSGSNIAVIQHKPQQYSKPQNYPESPGNLMAKTHCETPENTVVGVNPQCLGYTSGFRFYPAYRDHLKSGFIGARAHLDGAEGVYWRVHDKLYDLCEFAASHPGGRFLIDATRGLDVTELFESCHLSHNAARLLERYYVKPASEPRNSPYTFHEHGFYRTLKRRVAEQMASPGSRGPTWRSHALMDGVVALSLLTGVLAAYTNSVSVAVLAGVILHMVPNVAHNYIHQKPSWRNNYVGMTQAMTINGFRCMHVITHHAFPNTIYDFDIFFMEPLVKSLSSSKSWWNRWLSPVAFLLLVVFGGSPQILMNAASHLNYGIALSSLEWMLTFAWWPIYWLFSGFDYFTATKIWLIVAHCSFACSFLLFFAGTHRHPEDFHDGDMAREDKDWGLWQLDTANERREFQKHVFLKGALFGDHALHHLFPTIDFIRLPQLYPVVEEVCRQFGVEIRVYDQLEVTRDLFAQINRVESFKKPYKSED